MYTVIGFVLGVTCALACALVWVWTDPSRAISAEAITDGQAQCQRHGGLSELRAEHTIGTFNGRTHEDTGPVQTYYAKCRDGVTISNRVPVR